MPCHHFITLKIDDYLVGRLSPDDKLQFDIIIAHCPECHRFLEEQRAAFNLIRAVPLPEIPETYWSGLEKSILARLEDDEEIPVEKTMAEETKPRRIWNVLIPLAASFLIFLVSLTISDAPDESGAPETATLPAVEEIQPEPTSYANLIECQEILAISYITTSPPGTFGF